MRPRRRSSLLNNSTTTTSAVIVATMMIMLSSTSLLSSGGGYCLGRCHRHSSSSSFVVAALRSPSKVHRHGVQRYSRRHRRTAATTTQIAFQISSSSIVDNNKDNVARPSRRTNNDKLKALQSQASNDNQRQQLFNIDNDSNDYEQRRLLLQSNSKLALAPMMEYTDRHFRHLIRLLSDKTIVYSEMVAANAISHQTTGDQSQQRHSSDSIGGVLERGGGGPLRFLQQGHIPEGPSVLQLGGSDVHQLYSAARTVHQYYELQKQQLNEYDSNSCWIHNNGNSNSYNDDNSSGGGIAAAAAANSVVLNGKRDELLNRVHVNYTSLNLNCGCPSPKVANKGCFGAALMSDPNHVARLTKALHDGARGTMPVSVKCRIGTDDWMLQRGNGGLGFTRDGYTTLRSMKDEYAELCNFIEIVASRGTVTDFQIHARIAVLSKDYSPSENRKVPPLRYEHVRQLAIDYPELQFTLNGGCDTLLDVQRELELCNMLEGVMVGRGFVANPCGFATADELLYPTTTTTTTTNNNDRQQQRQRQRPRNRLEILEEYGKHADYEEARYGSSKVRRYILRAITNLFAGEHNSKHYRIALDEIVAASSSRKQRRILRGEEEGENESASSQLLLSELILQAATKHLSEEVLYRTPRESYDRMVYMAEQAEQKKNVITTAMFGGFGTSSSISSGGNNNGDTLVQQWQTSRKEE